MCWRWRCIRGHVYSSSISPAHVLPLVDGESWARCDREIPATTWLPKRLCGLRIFRRFNEADQAAYILGGEEAVLALPWAAGIK